VADGRYPDDLRYHPQHGWARIEGPEATFGITSYAQDSLQEIVHVDLPATGAVVTRDQANADIESLKAVSDLYPPCRARSSRSTTRWALLPPRSTRTPTGGVGSCG
jgi:glycine cleavage system H protein